MFNVNFYFVVVVALKQKTSFSFSDAPRVYPAQSLVIVNRSDTAILRCYVQSNPLPYEIVWLKNNYEIFRQNALSDLRIGHVERNDSGLYTCMIYNRLQNNLVQNGSSTMELRVQSRPILETTYSKIDRKSVV